MWVKAKEDKDFLNGIFIFNESWKIECREQLTVQCYLDLLELKHGESPGQRPQWTVFTVSSFMVLDCW